MKNFQWLIFRTTTYKRRRTNIASKDKERTNFNSCSCFWSIIRMNECLYDGNNSDSLFWCAYLFDFLVVFFFSPSVHLPLILSPMHPSIHSIILSIRLHRIEDNNSLSCYDQIEQMMMIVVNIATQDAAMIIITSKEIENIFIKLIQHCPPIHVLSIFFVFVFFFVFMISLERFYLREKDLVWLLLTIE